MFGEHPISLQLTHLLPSAAHPSSILGQNFRCCFLTSPSVLRKPKVVVGTHINNVLYHSPRVPVFKNHYKLGHLQLKKLNTPEDYSYFSFLEHTLKC